MRFYKGLLKFIQIFIVLVVLPRVASFVGLLGNNQDGFDLHDLIRFAFAITLGLGTIASAYFSDDTEAPEYDDEPGNPRERKRREREAVYFASMLNAAPYARWSLVLFAFLDGSFNLADALFGASQTGLIDPATHGNLAYVYMGATIMFGVSPTMLAIYLARLISMVDRIPIDYERPVSRKQMDVLRTVMGNLGLREYRYGDVAALYTEQPSTEQPSRTVRRTPNTLNIDPGEQRTKIIDYLDRVATPTNYPTISQIQEALEEPIPARSTISVVRNEWINNYDPLRGR